MQLTPRYEGDPIIRIDGFDADPVALMLQHRERLSALLGGLDDAQWRTPSRCEGWTVQDVVTHLVSTNQFWAFSITAGLAGTPSRFLASFDPVASPAELVAAAGSPSPAETLAAFTESNAALAAAASAIGDRTWTTLAEAPPGHISIGCLALHGVWDAVVHERDIAVPLGLPVDIRPDELAGALIYAAALSLGFHSTTGAGRTGAIAVNTTDPSVQVSVELTTSVLVHPGPAPADAVQLTGSTVDVLEALSCRAPLPNPVADDDRWVFEGLATVFDQTA